MEKDQATKHLFKGALLMTFAGLISKILSAGYRIPLQNITGDLGFYIYQQIYPFLGLALMLSLYGFPIAISKVVSEQTEGDSKLSLQSFYIPVSVVLLSFSGFIFLILFLNASSIASWMGDYQLTKLLKMAAFTFLLIPFTSLIRGVFQGINNMKPTALSQIVEQITRVGVILVSAIVIVKQGRNLYEIGNGAAVGSILGALVTFLVLLYLWLKRKPVHTVKVKVDWWNYVRTIVIYGLLISINHMVLLLFQFADALTLIPNLVAYGDSIEEAKVWKGIFDRGQPLIQLGTVLGSSLALALVPSITKRRMENLPQLFRSHLQSAIKLSFYLSAAATVGLISIFPHVNTLFFQDDKGTESLKVLVLAIFLASLGITTAAILQGLGHINSTAIYILVGVLMKWLLNSLLVPTFHIFGSASATVISVSVILMLNIFKLKSLLPDIKLIIVPWKPLLYAITGMILFLVFMNQWMFNFMQVTSRLDLLGYVLFVVFFGALIYLVLLVRFHGFTKEELRAFPFGEQLVNLSVGRKTKW